MTQQQGTLQQRAVPADIGSQSITWILIVGGVVLVPVIAKHNAVLVNGFLLLVLIGIVLGNANRWLPYLAKAAEVGPRSGTPNTPRVPPTAGGPR